MGIRVSHGVVLFTKFINICRTLRTMPANRKDDINDFCPWGGVQSHCKGWRLFTSVLLLVYFLWGHSPPSQSFRFAWGWLLLLASLANQCILSTQASVTGSVKGMWPSWSNETVCLPDEGRTYQGLRGPIRLALLTCPFLPSFSVFQPTGFQSIPWTRGNSEKHPPISDPTI